MLMAIASAISSSLWVMARSELDLVCEEFGCAELVDERARGKLIRDTTEGRNPFLPVAKGAEDVENCLEFSSCKASWCRVSSKGETNVGTIGDN